VYVCNGILPKQIVFEEIEKTIKKTMYSIKGIDKKHPAQTDFNKYMQKQESLAHQKKICEEVN